MSCTAQPALSSNLHLCSLQVCVQGAKEVSQSTVNERLQPITHHLSELTQAHQAVGVILGEVNAAVKELADDLEP